MKLVVEPEYHTDQCPSEPWEVMYNGCPIGGERRYIQEVVIEFIEDFGDVNLSLSDGSETFVVA